MLKALVVGVSNYTAMGEEPLPFCKNDILAVSEALINGLKFDKENIITCGESETVNKSDLIAALVKLIKAATAEDILIFYFSGHGINSSTGHHLLLSDNYINTHEIIGLLEKVTAKSKIVILDCCMSGNFTINQTASFDINQTVRDFTGKGYAVLASSNAMQVSYGHPDKPISLFTNFLCEALKDVYIIKEGKKSLYDISKLISLYIDGWNKNNPSQQQNPIFRANMGGTIFFEIKEYHPFHTAKIYEETDDYIIYAVEPLHTGLAKRYAVKVILKNPYTFEDISIINHEIVNKVKKANIYKNEISQRHWQGANANLVFCYYGRNESDVINANYLCHTTWADENQDKEHWYRIDNNSIIINDIHFNFHPYYEHLKNFIQENTGDQDMLIDKTNSIMSNLITLAEKVIGLYNEFLNNTISEGELTDKMEIIIPSIEKYYFDLTDLDIPPIELKDWSQCCSNLSGTIHNFTLFYNQKYLPSRTPQNRIACMNMTVKRYYEDLEALKEVKR